MNIIGRMAVSVSLRSSARPCNRSSACAKMSFCTFGILPFTVIALHPHVRILVDGHE